MLPESRGLYYNSSAGGGGIPPLQDTPSLPTSEYSPQYQALQQASDEFLSKPENQNVADALAQFNQYTKGHIKYSDSSISYIAKALPICVSHQLNEEEKSRVRKIDGTPYISHPLAMATEAARMRLDPTHVIACLLHDVPEDVKLGGLQASEDWLKMIAETYKDYDDVDRLMRILRAEQKTESLEKLPDREHVIDYYADSALGRRALNYLQQSRQRHGNELVEPSHADRESIAKVLYDMNRMISDSFVGEPGHKVFDPSIIVVKILDTWQNLQTPGFIGDNITNPKTKKDASTMAKLIRARMLANMAEFMGMREVTSSMTEMLACLQDLYDIDKLDTSSIEFMTHAQARMKEKKDHATEIAPTLNHALWDRRATPRSLAIPHFQVPWGVVEQDPVIGDDTTPPIVWHIQAYPDQINHVIQPKPFAHSGTNFDIRGPLGVKHGALRAAIQSAYGRKTLDYRVFQEGRRIGELRVEANDTRPISTLKAREHRPDPARFAAKLVPEYNLFHSDIAKYTEHSKTGGNKPTSLAHIDTKLLSLLEFAYSPREFLSNTTGVVDTPYMLVIGGKVFLATNKTDLTLRTICDNEGVRNPVAYQLGGSLDDAVAVRKHDHRVLARMQEEGKLALNMVVISTSPEPIIDLEDQGEY